MIKSLTNTSLSTIVECLSVAFADYSVSMPSSTEYWNDRWEAAGVDYNLSYGYFDNDRLVGFVIHAIGMKHDKLNFFNLGTGVIPEFRGQKIVKQIYDICYHELLKRGCDEGRLEVIQSNQKAIKAYQSVGFNLNLELISYYGKFIEPSGVYNIKNTEFQNLEKYTRFKHHHLAWEHRDSIILHDTSQFNFYELFKNQECVGFAIVKKANSDVAQFGVKNNNLENYGLELFGALYNIDNNIKMINVDSRNKSLIQFFEKNNFKVLIKQFEMLLEV